MYVDSKRGSQIDLRRDRLMRGAAMLKQRDFRLDLPCVKRPKRFMAGSWQVHGKKVE